MGPAPAGRGADLGPAVGRRRHEHQRHRLPPGLGGVGGRAGGGRHRGRRRPRRCHRGGRARPRPPAGGRRRGRDDAHHRGRDGRRATTPRPGRSRGRSSSSSLVKAAAHGRDPNWGRIAGAAGNARLADAAVLEAAGLPAAEARRVPAARPSVDPATLRIAIAGHVVFDGAKGGPVEFDRAAARAAMEAPELVIGARPRARRRAGRGLRLRPDRGVRHRELGVHDVSEILVVKLGGTTIAEQSQVLEEVAAVARRRPVVLVHGGGKRITEWLERLGVPSKFEGGLRVTDAPVARGRRRGPARRRQQRARRRACATSGSTRSGCRASTAACSSPSGSRSWGSSRSVVGLRRDLLDAILVGGQVPVVAPLARDADGIVCNVNADDAAAGIAAGIGARQLVLLTDVDGVRDADGRRLDALTAGEAETLIDIGRHRRRDGAQGPGRARRARLGRRRGDHRRLVGARRAGPRPRRPDVRDADHAPTPCRAGGRGDERAQRPPAERPRLRRRERQRAIRELVASRPVGSQREVVERLADAGLRGDPGDRVAGHRRARAGQGARAPMATVYVAAGRPRHGSGDAGAAVRRAPPPDPRRHPGHDRPERADPAC